IVRRRHYEKLAHFPAGLIVMGDGFCAFDPVFGQGMSVAAKEAIVLDELLANGSYNDSPDFPRRFHRRAAAVVMPAWLLGTSEDFRFEKTEGKKPFFIPLLHWYSRHIFELSATDKEVYNAFRQVLHLLSGPALLFKPTLVAKVVIHGLA